LSGDGRTLYIDSNTATRANFLPFRRHRQRGNVGNAWLVTAASAAHVCKPPVRAYALTHNHPAARSRLARQGNSAFSTGKPTSFRYVAQCIASSWLISLCYQGPGPARRKKANARDYLGIALGCSILPCVGQCWSPLLLYSTSMFESTFASTSPYWSFAKTNPQAKSPTTVLFVQIKCSVAIQRIPTAPLVALKRCCL
jgi:hypothetical protein